MIPRQPTFTLFPYTTLFRSMTTSNTAAKTPMAPRRACFTRRGPDSGLTAERQWSFAMCNPQQIASFGSLAGSARSEEHTSELQSHSDLVCRLLLEKKKHELE